MCDLTIAIWAIYLVRRNLQTTLICAEMKPLIMRFDDALNIALK